MREKILKALVLLVIAVVFMISCQEDESSVHKSNLPSSVDVSFVNYNELSKSEILQSALSKYNLRISGKVQRKEYSGAYDFYVETDSVMKISRDKYSSYTFFVKRDVPSQYRFENLFLHPYNGGYLAYLIKYNLTETEYENLKVGKVVEGLAGKFIVQPLQDIDIDLGVSYATASDDDNTQLAPDHSWYEDGKCWHWVNLNGGSGSDGLWQQQECPDCECKPPSSSGGGGFVNYIQSFVFFDIRGWAPGGGASTSDGSNGGWGGGPFNPGGSNSSGSGPQNGEPIIGTFPTQQLQTVDQKNVIELKKLGTTVNIMESYNDLKSKTKGAIAYREYGYGFNDNNSQPVELPLYDESPNQIKIKYGTWFYGASHTHPDQTLQSQFVPMFSLSDIYSLAAFKKYYFGNQSADNSKYVFTLTADYGGYAHTFALKITNWEQFKTTFADKWEAKTAKQRESWGLRLANRYTKKQTQDSDTSSDGYLKVLMKFLNEEGIKGIGIYKSENTLMTNWKRMAYNNGILTEITID